MDESAVTFIKDSKGRLFGAFTTEPWKHLDTIFGLGGSFVWRFTGDPSKAGTSNDYSMDLEVFDWTEENDVFMQSRKDSISLGGGAGGPALYIDASLLNGASHKSATFKNEPLSVEEDFKVLVLEVWGLGWKKLPELRDERTNLCAPTEI